MNQKRRWSNECGDRKVHGKETLTHQGPSTSGHIVQYWIWEGGTLRVPFPSDDQRPGVLTPVATEEDLTAWIVVVSSVISSTPDLFQRVRRAFLGRCRLRHDLHGYNNWTLPFRTSIGPAENPDTAAHIITDPSSCLTAGRRQSQPDACVGVLEACTRHVVV
ncbi:hypothetical protein TNCV_4408771 [Trichonephila clavipes]|nr:hypothetical protein TNCV_4408771 [Trichonephila clavipes]